MASIRVRAKGASVLRQTLEATLTSFYDNHLNGSVLSEGLSRSKSVNFSRRYCSVNFCKDVNESREAVLYSATRCHAAATFVSVNRLSAVMGFVT